jgi:hypothetical protein
MVQASKLSSSKLQATRQATSDNRQGTNSKQKTNKSDKQKNARSSKRLHQKQQNQQKHFQPLEFVIDSIQKSSYCFTLKAALSLQG